MRLAPLLALFLAAPALHAQSCVPDPNPPASYYPLGVGDEWIYHVPAFSGNAESFVTRRVLRDEAVGGLTYAVDQLCFTPVAGGPQTCRAERFVRVGGGNVVVRTEGGESTVFEDLGAPLGQNPLNTCAPDLGTGVVIGDISYTVARVKGLPGYIDFAPPPFAAGVGPLGLIVGNLAERTDRFEYARIGGVQYGVRPPGVPGPDPVPAAEYYPLEVGNEWIYRFTEQSVFGTFDAYTRRRVLREEAVGGQTYAVDQECVYNLLVAAPAWVCEPERLVRFDPATTNVVARNSAGGEYIVECQLGADFGVPRACAPSGGGAGRWVDLGPGPVLIGGQSVPVVRVKRESSLANVPPPVYIAGIGRGEVPVGAFQTSSFEFARVRGVEYGVRPVAGESGAPAADALALTATPNPTSGALRLALTLPEAQTVTAEAFDALGRRVWQQTAALSAGPQTLTVDASAWAPGVYVVRATAGTASATARIVRH